MKTGIYIYCGAKTKFSGVEKKIDNQITAFSKHFQMRKVVIEKEETNVLKSIAWRMPWGSFGRKYDAALSEIDTYSAQNNGIDFFYIRKGNFDRRYIKFLYTLRERFPEAKILLEVPTYPYDRELLQSSTMWPWYFKDIANRNHIRKFVDRIVTFSDDDLIYGVPTIRTQNGIIVDQIQPAFGESYNDSEIHLLAVAQFQKSHGYERIIKGLNTYYKTEHAEKVILDMVGYGDELPYYQKLVAKYGLGDVVIFHGYKIGDELKDIYSTADVALGAFGRYKVKVYKICTLKVVEYFSYGIPAISGCKEGIVDSGSCCEFYKEFPNDNSEINICELLEFYNKLKEKYDIQTLRKLIHDYAKNTVDMNIVMKDIINYIEYGR